VPPLAAESAATITPAVAEESKFRKVRLTAYIHFLIYQLILPEKTLVKSSDKSGKQGRATNWFGRIIRLTL